MTSMLWLPGEPIWLSRHLLSKACGRKALVFAHLNQVQMPVHYFGVVYCCCSASFYLDQSLGRGEGQGVSDTSERGEFRAGPWPCNRGQITDIVEPFTLTTKEVVVVLRAWQWTPIVKLIFQKNSIPSHHSECIRKWRVRPESVSQVIFRVWQWL